MEYNIDFGLGAAAYMAILYIFLRIRYSSRPRRNREFRKITFLVLLADILDIAAAIAVSYEGLVPKRADLLLFVLSFFYIIYAAAIRMRSQQVFQKKQKVTFCLFIAVSLLGPLVQWLIFPQVLLGMFTLSLAVFIMLLSMETSDGLQVERLSAQIMKTLADTIDAKDKYTNGHSIRVAEYSREIARRIGKSEREQQDIYYMGLLHDIGKIGIQDTIITKPSGLTDEEYTRMKCHPVIGADILKNMSEIPGIDAGARWHHEKYDGTGYPDGLKGEEIPEVARIIGVADAYDAMASKRSYRDVLPQEVVRAEIEKGKGTQFDPVFADKMLEMIDGDKEYQMREK